MTESVSDTTLAVIGVGQLANYTLAGMRRSGDARRVLLSPHNRANAQDIAAKYDCEIAGSNQDAVDAAAIVLLATRPENTIEALEALELRADQVVLSVVAGISLEALAPLAAPATAVRSLPVCCAEVGVGGMPLYPNDERAHRFLSTMGAVVVMDDEPSFDTMAVTGCAIIWMAQVIAELQHWLENNGVPHEQARAMALHSAHGASGLPLAKPDLELDDLVETIARPGTYTRMGMGIMQEHGGFSAMHKACDEILARFQATD